MFSSPIKWMDRNYIIRYFCSAEKWKITSTPVKDNMFCGYLYRIQYLRWHVFIYLFDWINKSREGDIFWNPILTSSGSVSLISNQALIIPTWFETRSKLLCGSLASLLIILLCFCSLQFLHAHAHEYDKVIQRYTCIYIYIYIWVNYNDLTATEPWE